MNTPDGRIKEIEMLLARSNVITRVDLNLRKFTKDEIGDFCQKYGLTWGVGQHGDWVWMEFYRDGKFMTGEDFDKLNFERPPQRPLPQMSILPDAPFGWLSPLGDFTEADFGDHEKAAGGIVENKGWEDEYFDWRRKTQHMHLMGDYLSEVKGYALLHNPMLGGFGQTMVTHMKPLTKKQRDFLFAYYSDAGVPKLAERYL